MAPRLTNRLGLPDAVVKAVQNDPYTRGNAHVSVTALINKPPRAFVLEQQHAESLVEDVADRIFSLIGQVGHGILERSGAKGIIEERYFIEISGWTVSGAVDHYLDGVISDYKFISAWKLQNRQVPEEYIAQLNCYAELMREHGHEVTKLQIVAIYRDWSKPEARRSAEYPQQQAALFELPLWPREKVRSFLAERVRAFQRAANEELPECSPEERWEKPTVFAVMKEGAKRALKLYEREQDAIDHASTAKVLRVERRQGESTRCELYCSVAPFCSQFASMKGSESQKESE